MDTLANILYLISNSLLLPVVAVLLILFMATVLQLGGFASEAICRWRRRPAMISLLVSLKSDRQKTVTLDQIPASFGLPARACHELQTETACPDKVLDDLQLYAERILGRLNIGVRLGPLLGLAGTLIPLGPALMAMSKGDFNTLAVNLVLAFTTTVLGLVIGGTCFAIHIVRLAWYMQDINDMEFLMKRRRSDA